MKHMHLAFAFLLAHVHRQKRWAKELLQGAFSQSDTHACKSGRTRPNEQTQNFKNAGRAEILTNGCQLVARSTAAECTDM